MALLFNADEIFAMGVQIEKKGQALYASAAERTVDADLKGLFLQLADWEYRHMTLFENLRLKLPSSVKESDVYDPENMVHLYLKAVADNNVFVKGLALDPAHLVWTTPAATLATALDFEKDSVVFFSSMKEITNDATGKKEVEKLITEEMRHIGFIMAEIRKLG
jgi:rubrerythrin